MEKFFVFNNSEEIIGKIEAEDIEGVLQHLDTDENSVIVNVDEAMTLAEALIEFIAEYRQGLTHNPKPYCVRSVLQDIGRNLKTIV